MLVILKGREKDRLEGAKGSGVCGRIRSWTESGESRRARRIDDRESSLTAAFAFLLSRRPLVDEETTNSGRHMADYSPQDVESRSFCPPLTKYHVDRRMHFRSFRNSLRGFCGEKEISKVCGEIRIDLSFLRYERNVSREKKKQFYKELGDL